MARTRSKRGEGSSKRSSRASRRKQKATTPPATATPSQPLTLQNFATLPYEVQIHIIQLACSPTPPSSTPPVDETASYSRQSTPTYYPWKRHPRQRLDHNTSLSLMLASKKLNELVVPVLYESVWLSRPSALASFQSALSARPQLARIVRSLHVGPDSTMPGWYHPLSIEDTWGSSWPARTSITTSLRDPEDGNILPAWCSRHFNLEWDVKSPGHDAPSKAVHQALLVAQRNIDVDLYRYQRSMRGIVLSSHEAQVRTWEVQASLDLYLMAMRRWEDEHGISSSGDSKDRSISDYPPLTVTGYSTSTHPASQSSASVAPFTVSRSELLRHLARPHAITDRFDHPLIFARSGVENFVFSDGITEIDRRNRHESTVAEEWSAIFAPRATGLDLSLPNTATIGSLLDLLRAVLVVTRNLVNLSLTGFLDLAIFADHPTTFTLKHLKSLSTGPPPLYWFEPLPLTLNHVAVEELRICGLRLHEDELNELLAKLPSLRKLQWSIAGRYPWNKLETLRSIIYRLAGATQRAQGGHDEQSSVDKVSTADSIPTEASAIDVKGPLPLVEVRMAATDLKSLLDEVSDPATRLAWQSGTALPGQSRRLLLAEHPSRTGLYDYRASGRVANREDLYQEGMDWWEDHGGGCRIWGLE